MIRGCLAQIITWGLIGTVVLWVLGNPESVAALVGTGIGLVVTAGESIGTVVTLTVGEINGLL
ncbi:hypothetical protein [Nocardiopsis dassonvillei]|uniref:hypothetical protein n=1 Tax=Nocardiopsis dassonvillei TaxID=2014 RepID=UPI00157C7A0F|nr:hypothetical protein [Nocardiopsis dassonvillei]